MQISYNAYVLTDKEHQLIVRGVENKNIALALEKTTQLPSLFKTKKQAEACLKSRHKLPLTTSANSFLKLYKMNSKDRIDILRPAQCTVTLNIEDT